MYKLTLRRLSEAFSNRKGVVEEVYLFAEGFIRLESLFRFLLLLLRIRSAHPEILGFPMGGAY